MLSLRTPALLLLIWFACQAEAQSLVGGQFEYTVAKGDYLTRIGARFGMDPMLLARENGLDYFGVIHPGQRLSVDNRHVVPVVRETGILLNIPQRMLYLFREGRLVAHCPVGLGRANWPTPLGRFTVRSKETDKEWVVPESIQAEMLERGEEVLTRVPAGPVNPLGRHGIGLSPGRFGLHGTIAPPSVYHFQSHGCIRLHPDDAAALYGLVRIGEAVEMVYRPLLLARAEGGAIYLEAHRDVYNRGGDPWRLLLDEVGRSGLARELDWKRVAEVIRRREGVARWVGPVEKSQVQQIQSKAGIEHE